MRSTTAGMGTPGGEGVIHSPRSIVMSAITPRKGARMTVFASSALATWIWVRSCATRARDVPLVPRLVEHLLGEDLVAHQPFGARQLLLGEVAPQAGLLLRLPRRVQ